MICKSELKCDNSRLDPTAKVACGVGSAYNKTTNLIYMCVHEILEQQWLQDCYTCLQERGIVHKNDELPISACLFSEYKTWNDNLCE